MVDISGEGLQQTRDEFGTDPDELTVVKIAKDTIRTSLLTTVVKTRDTEPDTIWFREIWLANSWDASYDNSFVWQRVVSPNNTFREVFRNNQFLDSGNTTASWSTTNYYLEIASGEVAQSNEIFLNDETIVRATINVTGTLGPTLMLSANAGSSWETVTNGVEHEFTTTGTDLRFKFEASAAEFPLDFPVSFGGSSGRFNEVKVNYITS